MIRLPFGADHYCYVLTADYVAALHRAAAEREVGFSCVPIQLDSFQGVWGLMRSSLVYRVEAGGFCYQVGGGEGEREREREITSVPAT
jgi:hypothetical protein